MLGTIALCLALTATALAQNSAKDEAQVWELEKAYWEYVKANDLEKYRALWHENFVGWPFVNPAPVSKDHITDWITLNTSKGIKLQSYSIEQLAIQVTGDIALDYYRINATWANSTGAPESGPTECGSRTRGFEHTARGKSSVACPRP